MNTSVKESHLEVNSMLGKIGFERYLVHCRRCGYGYAPFDREIQVDELHKLTKKLKEVICDFAQRMVFEEASEMLERRLGIKVSSSLIQKVSEEVGKILYENEVNQAKEVYENQHKTISKIPENQKKGRLYIEADGSMVLVRGEGWKEIKLGMVFKDSKVINRDKERHIIVEKEYTTCLGTAEQFKKMLYALAVRNGCQDVKEVVILGDGSVWIWNMAKELFPDAIFILDYYHFSEHVCTCAKEIYPEDEFARHDWAKNITESILEGEIDKAIKDLKNSEYESKEIRENIEQLVTYIENNRDKLRYREYREKGYFIGSGAIESGHKNVIQHRLKQAGMRWNRTGGQYIASLRAAHKSNRWDKITEIIYAKAC